MLGIILLKGNFTELIEQEEATQSGKINSTEPFTQSVAQEP